MHSDTFGKNPQHICVCVSQGLSVGELDIGRHTDSICVLMMIKGNKELISAAVMRRKLMSQCFVARLQ